MGFDYRISTELGKQTLGGHKQKRVCTRSQEKGAVSPKMTELDFLMRVQESGGSMGQHFGLRPNNREGI